MTLTVLAQMFILSNLIDEMSKITCIVLYTYQPHTIYLIFTIKGAHMRGGKDHWLLIYQYHYNYYSITKLISKSNFHLTPSYEKLKIKCILSLLWVLFSLQILVITYYLKCSFAVAKIKYFIFVLHI